MRRVRAHHPLGMSLSARTWHRCIARRGRGDLTRPAGTIAAMASATEASAASPAERSTAPRRAGLVLGALILVASVANLNLAVANVALPDIGKGFDASQTALDLIAVGYSLGLAASVLYLGALGDRYGRKMMLVLGTVLAIPASILAATRRERRRALRRAHLRRARGRDGLPDDARADHRAVVGPGAHEGDRAVVGHRRRRCRRSARCCRGAARAPRLGLGLPDHRAARGARARHAGASCPPTSTRPPSPSTTSAAILSIVAGRRAGAGDQLRARTRARARLAIAWAWSRSPPARVLLPAPAPHALPAVSTCRWPRRRIFWVAALAGIIVFGSLMGAMFVGQQFLQNVLGYSTLEAGPRSCRRRC